MAGQVERLSCPPLERLFRDVSDLYSPEGELGCWWDGVMPAEWTAEMIIRLLTEHSLLPSPQEGQRVKILSPSANAGRMEAAFQATLGPKYLIIAGDIARLRPVQKDLPYLRTNAVFLPFAKEQFSMILDWKGAAWYIATEDKRNEAQGNFIRLLFQEFTRVLNIGGIIVIDDGPSSAGSIIDEVMRKNCLDGLSAPVSIPTCWTDTMRVYRKS